MVISQVVGIFNIFVGLMLVSSFLLFFGGLMGWFSRLGVWPGYRDDMIRYQMWGVAVMFMLVVLLAAAHFIQYYQGIAAFLFGLLIFIAVVWLAFQVAKGNNGEEEEEH